jgi:hypothetical protein
MSEQSKPTTTLSPEPLRPRRRWRWLVVTTIALVAAIGGAVATRAGGHYGAHGWGHMHGGAWFMRDPLSGAEIDNRVDRAVRNASSSMRHPNSRRSFATLPRLRSRICCRYVRKHEAPESASRDC